jgi:hypothetical protein
VQIQTNTNGVDFLLNFLQGALYTNGSALNTNAVSAQPTLLALDSQSAQQQSGRNPGGQAYQKPSNAAYIPPNAQGTVVANTNAGCVLIGGYETRPSKLGTTKSGAFLVTMNGTNAVNLNLTNTAVNTNAQVGDTTFTYWNQIIVHNLTGQGIDNTNGASLTLASTNTNGANLGIIPVNALGGLVVPAASAYALQNWNTNGTPLNSSALNATLTPTGSGQCVVEISGG